MKKRMIVALFILVTLVACEKTSLFEDRVSNSSATSVPKAVSKSLVDKFGNVSVTEWKLRSDGTWRAHFTFNGIAWEATFASDGTLVKSEPA
jgi:uncharacterized lipoprotein NlpE involved in copper resistance